MTFISSSPHKVTSCLPACLFVCLLLLLALQAVIACVQRPPDLQLMFLCSTSRLLVDEVG